MNAIQGVTLDVLAEIQGKISALQAQFGEPAFRPHFLAFLASKGLSEAAYVDAYNAWLARFRSDPSGQLQAEFSMKVARLAAQAHYGDVRDMSGDVQQGVTLDAYAQLCVAMGKPGIDPEAVARQYGLQGVAHWQAANAAWTAAMDADTTHALKMQFGQLYSRHAGPEFEQNMQNQVAASLAAAQQRPAAPAEPQREQTVQELIQTLSAPDLRVRFRAARDLAHRWDIGHERDPSLGAALACVPVLVEMVERHDDDQTSEAEDAARKLVDLEQTNDDVRGSIQRCLHRASEQLATLERAFAPIQSQAVPERIPLQMKIGGYRSLIDALRSILAQWPGAQAAGAPPPQPAYGAPGPMPGSAAGHVPGQTAQTAGQPSPPKRDFSALILIVVVLLVGGATLLTLRYRAQIRAEALSNPLDSDSSSAATDTPPPSAAPHPTLQPKPPPTPTATSTVGGGHPPKKKK